MSKIYLKNTYFNNNTISIHLAENDKFYIVEQVNDGHKSKSKISKTREDSMFHANQKYYDKISFTRKIIESTNFNSSANQLERSKLNKAS
jgi:hypothetical protein